MRSISTSHIDRPSSESMVSGRVDWNIRASDRAFLLVQYDHGKRAVYVDPISPLFDAYRRAPWWQGQLVETHSFGPTAANQFLLGGNYYHYLYGVANPAQTQAAFPTVLNWAMRGGQPLLSSWEDRITTLRSPVVQKQRRTRFPTTW